MANYQVTWLDSEGHERETPVDAESPEGAAFKLGRAMGAGGVGDGGPAEIVAVSPPPGWHITTCGWCGGEAAHEDNCKHDS